MVRRRQRSAARRGERRLGHHSERADENLKASYKLTQPTLEAPLAKNQVVGTIDFQLDGKTIEQHPLVVMQEVKEGNFFSRIWDMVMMKLSQWFGGIFG